MKKLFTPRTLFTGLFFVTTAYLFIKGESIPDFLQMIDVSLLGFYFGEKAIKQAKK